MAIVSSMLESVSLRLFDVLGNVFSLMAGIQNEKQRELLASGWLSQHLTLECRNLSWPGERTDPADFRGVGD